MYFCVQIGDILFLCRMALTNSYAILKELATRYTFNFSVKKLFQVARVATD